MMDYKIKVFSCNKNLKYENMENFLISSSPQSPFFSVWYIVASSAIILLTIRGLCISITMIGFIYEKRFKNKFLGRYR